MKRTKAETEVTMTKQELIQAAQSMEIPKPMRRRGSDYLQWAVIAIIVYLILRLGG